MGHDLVSVVIPAYNVEKYIVECLESVVGQTYTDLEIIIVDDGSVDGSGVICDEYAKRDGRIQVVHQANSGAAAARKKGIQISNGKYLCFVDSDDKIDLSMIEYFVANIGNCDLITSGCYYETLDGEWIQRYDAFAPGIYEDESELNFFLNNYITYNDRMEDGVLPFLYTKMYKNEIAKEVVNNIDLGIKYAEDRDFLFQYILKCQSICITHMCFYYYQNNSGSIMNNVNKNFMNDLNRLYLSLEQAFSKHPAKKELMHQLQLFIMSRIYRIPEFMRFDPEVQMVHYTFPFYNLPGMVKLILYGAGILGLDYYRQIKKKEEFDLVLWVDKNWEKYQDRFASVVSPDCIAEVEYDYIILAVSIKYVDEVREELIAKGVPESKMLWEKSSRLYM